MTKKSSARLAKDRNPPRDKAAIDTEYAQVCAMLGDKDYRLEILKSEMVTLRNRLYALNLEAKEATDELMANAPEAEPVSEEVVAPADLESVEVVNNASV